MIVKCIANHGKNLNPIFYMPKDGFYEKTEFYIKLNQNYIVYGMTLFGGFVWYYICEEKNSTYPFWHPCALFTVVNPQLSKYWIYSFVNKIEPTGIFTKTLWAYPEWANDPYYYSELVDGNPKEEKIFQKYKALMDVEFPNPEIQDTPKVMDDHWLFCSYCINAWQSFSEDAMIYCPTCQRMMHNPHYVNPLKTLKDFS